MSKRAMTTPLPYKKRTKKAKAQPANVVAVNRYLDAKVEKKNFDALSTANLVIGSTTAVVTQIFVPDQGTAPTERVGRRTIMKSLQYRFVASMAPTSTGASPIRMVIVYDRQPNAATPATTAVFVTDAIHSPLNLQNSRRFTVISDSTGVIGTAGPQSMILQGFRKLNNLNTEYNDVNGGTIADITTGSLIMYVWSQGTFTVAAPTNAIFTRVRFTDM